MSAIACQQIIKGKPCPGTIDPDEGVCGLCGRAPAKGALRATAALGTQSTGTTGTAKTGSGRVSRRQTTASTSRRQSELGGGLVSLPPVPSQDPMALVMTTPEVSPNKRVCPGCGARVNRMNGFCPQCAAAYDFRPSLKTGDIVGGKYEVRGPIGLGGMGWIYLGHDVILKRWVVLKGLLNEKDPEAAAAAVAERQFLAAVKHPNIVSIYDFVSEGSNGYMVLEYVGGRTLDQLRGDFDLVDLVTPDDGAIVRKSVLRKDIADADKHLIAQVVKFGVLPPEQAIAYVMALCPAFAYLHAAGFTHNDMKPDNVMIDGDRVKLIDLGAMRKIGDAGGLIFGTEGFFAPEASDDPIAVSDLYGIGRALAVLLMDFLYKYRLDRDQTTRKVTTRRLIVTGYKTAIPSPDEQAILTAYDSLYRFLLRATHENPDQRFQSAEEMQFQLFGLLREIMAEKTGPKPADSRVFFNDGLVDAGDVEGASAPVARLLPALRLDPNDAAANEILGLSALADPAKRVDELTRLAAKRPLSQEAPLRLADALIDAGRLEAAITATDQILAKNEFEWRAHWRAGKALLATALTGEGIDHAKKALDRFDRVYFEMPGELAPRLAIGMAAEAAGDLKTAAMFYGRVVMIDPGMASATFGLARCRRAQADFAGAATALSAVPPSHSMYTEARLALARVYVAADPTTNPDFLGKASETLGALKSDTAAFHELCARLLVKAAESVESGKVRANGDTTLLEAPMRAAPLRSRAAAHFAAVGRFAPSANEKARWIDMSNSVRPLTLF